MISYEALRSNINTVRGKIGALILANQADADRIPAGWNNNLHWHAGHLVVTPRRVTSMQLGESIGLPDAYNKWFARDTSPRTWGNDPVPPVDVLVAQLVPEIDKLFTDMESRLDEAYPKPMQTAAGLMLSCPRDGLALNAVHDAIHLGMILALVRALKN